MNWQQHGNLWFLNAAGRSHGTVQFIGGSYLATTPQLSYRRLLEALAKNGLNVQAWSYVPRECREDRSDQRRWISLRSVPVVCRWQGRYPIQQDEEVMVT